MDDLGFDEAKEYTDFLREFLRRFLDDNKARLQDLSPKFKTLLVGFPSRVSLTDEFELIFESLDTMELWKVLNNGNREVQALGINDAFDRAFAEMLNSTDT